MPQKNPFENRAPILGGPAKDLIPVTPGDFSDLPGDVAAALHFEVAGTVNFTSLRGEIRSVGVLAHTTLNLAVRRVHATGTHVAGTIHAYVAGYNWRGPAFP